MILELRVACPVCRAHPGQDCHGLSGHGLDCQDPGTPAVPPHEARSRVARRTVCHPLTLELHVIDR